MTDEQAPPAPAHVDRPPLSELAGIRYVGTSDRRYLTGYELAAVGVQSDHDLQWERGGVAPINRLNAAIVDLLAADPDFELVLKDA